MSRIDCVIIEDTDNCLAIAEFNDGFVLLGLYALGYGKMSMCAGVEEIRKLHAGLGKWLVEQEAANGVDR